MSRFTVILPEGTVILKNEETGQILRLSAESGPLVLGEIEMSMTLGPRPLEVAGAAHAPAVAAAQAPACELPARPADPLRPSCPDPRRLAPRRFRTRFRGPRA